MRRAIENKRSTRPVSLVSLKVFSAAVFLFTFAFGQPVEYSQAPQFAVMVESGALPPVEERLPNNPMVVEVWEEIGVYGGDWRMGMVGGADGGMIRTSIAYENLVRWAPDYERILPNIAESFEVNENATEYTFYLREGMKWSDGHPFTADDIMFWYEDVFLNEELNPLQSGMLYGGALEAVEKLDDYSVSFRFATPHGLFLQTMAQIDGILPTLHPKHYLSRFHPRHNADNLGRLVLEAGVADWVALFQAKGGGGVTDDRFMNVELPVLSGWKIVQPLGDTQRVVAERNPYYWKVDNQGNQLPYLDRVILDQFSDAEVVLLRALNGEIDLQHRHIASPANRPVLIDNMERGDYSLTTLVPTTVNNVVLMLNLNHPDPVKREIYQNKNFRIGLSHAIDRQEIIDLVYVGQGEPHQGAPRPDSEFYHERLAKQYTEYDVDLANEHLDRAGYGERDAQGYRLGPDGNRITLTAEVSLAEAEIVDAMELVEQYWRAVGLDIQYRTMDRALWETRIRGGSLDWDVTAHRWGGGSGQEVITDPRYWLPFDSNSLYARAWSTWFATPTGGGPISPEEPPADVQQQLDLYRQLRMSGDRERQAELMWEILDMAVEQFYVIGIKTEGDSFGVRKNGLRNVPETMYDSYRWPTPGPTNPEQYFWSN